MANGIFFTQQFWPSVNGVAEHSHQIAKHLTELGENITLLHVVREGYEGEDEFDRNCGYPVVRFSTKIGTGGWYKDPWARRLLVTTLVKEARRIDADYVIYNGVGSNPGIRGKPLFNACLAAAPRILGIPAFLYIHDTHGLATVRETKSRFQALMANWLWKSAAGVLTVSYWNLPRLEEVGLNSGRVHVIHNGFDLREADAYLRRRDPGRFSRLDAAFPEGSPVIFSVARLVPHKRIDRLIEIMPSVLAAVPGARLVIAGTGDEEERLREMIAESPASDSITMLGMVSPDEKFECYARSDVFALATDYEGFGLIFLEANAFGKPVVATRVGGVPEAVEHGVCGLLVEPGDSQALADAIIRLLSNSEEARRLGECGRRRVETEFTWHHSAEKLLTIVNQAMKARK